MTKKFHLLIFFVYYYCLLSPSCCCDGLALKVGKRRILCSTPIGGGRENVDALMDPSLAIPVVTGFVGCQAALPSFGKCPNDYQFQVPWFKGDGGSGLCPPEFWNAGALAPGFVLIILGLALNAYSQSNRLLITDTSIGMISTHQDITSTTTTSSSSSSSLESSLTQFQDIEEWTMTPLGLVLKLKSSSYKFFPSFWDPKSVEALLSDRLD
mmetsp:Transcript_20958/g.31617  ORF Transcript_20958/g.31617 Transcript_20958/m.31617 type:complete len:211 (+) Transcript_20958:31-663(+)